MTISITRLGQMTLSIKTFSTVILRIVTARLFKYTVDNDTQHHGTDYNDNQHSNTQLNDTQHHNKKVNPYFSICRNLAIC
jgi:hypothetical protein